jgi:hypothetical protein
MTESEGRLKQLFEKIGGEGLTSAEAAEFDCLLASARTAPPIPQNRRYAKRLGEYAAIFARSPRAIKSWIAAGRNADPPSLPPFDEPAAMLAWWTRHMKRRPPDSIVAMAVDRQILSNWKEATAGVPLEVEKLALNVDALQQARVFLAAANRKLQTAYLDGNEAGVHRAHRLFESAMETFRKAQISSRAESKTKGDLVSKAELFPEISHALEVLRAMRETMARRIMRRVCGRSLQIPAGLEAELSLAIEAERGSEDAILRRLATFETMNDVVFALESPAGQ